MKNIFKNIGLGLILSLSFLKAGLQSPQPEVALEYPMVKFVWDKVGTSSKYWLTVGTTEGGNDIYDKIQYYVPVVTVKNIPITGKPIYVKVGTNINGQYQFDNYVIETKAKGSKLTSPTYGIKIASDSLDFEWEDTGADAYHLKVGTAKGTDNIFNYEGSDTEVAVDSIPKDAKIYVTLSTKYGETWIDKEYEFGAGTQTVIDSLILYSSRAKELYPDTEARILHHIAMTNKVYRDSGLNVELNPIHIEFYDVNESDSLGNTLKQARRDVEVEKLRNLHGADNVIVYRELYSKKQVGGIAYPNTVNMTSAAAYLVVGIEAPAGRLTAHEVGHTMGLAHDVHDFNHRSFMYSRGHGEVRKFITIMARSQVFATSTMVYKFSSPNLECNGYPCGIAEGEENSADSVKALRYAIPIYANFRSRVENSESKKFSDALRAYEIKRREIEYLEKRVLRSKDAYLNGQELFIEKRVAYQHGKEAFIQARADRRAGKISKEELATIKASFLELKRKFKSERKELKSLYTTWTERKKILANAKVEFRKLESQYLALK